MQHAVQLSLVKACYLCVDQAAWQRSLALLQRNVAALACLKQWRLRCTLVWPAQQYPLHAEIARRCRVAGTCIRLFAGNLSGSWVRARSAQHCENLAQGPDHLSLQKPRPSQSQSHIWSVLSSLICDSEQQAAYTRQMVRQQVLAIQDTEYNHASNAAYWETRPVLVTKRTLEIGMRCPLSVLSIIVALSQLHNHMWHAGFAFSQWFVQTRLSRKGNDFTTLTNKQVCHDVRSVHSALPCASSILCTTRAEDAEGAEAELHNACCSAVNGDSSVG